MHKFITTASFQCYILWNLQAYLTRHNHFYLISCYLQKNGYAEWRKVYLQHWGYSIYLKLNTSIFINKSSLSTPCYALICLLTAFRLLQTAMAVTHNAPSKTAIVLSPLNNVLPWFQPPHFWLHFPILSSKCLYFLYTGEYQHPVLTPLDFKCC